MPYSRNTDLPARVKNVLPAAAQTIFREAFNASVDKWGEERAFKIAWGAVKRKYKKGEGKKWVRKEDVDMNFDIIPILDNRITILEEIEGAGDGRMRIEGVALIDNVLSKNKRFYSPAFNDAVAEETQTFIDRAGIVTMFSRHGQAVPQTPWGLPTGLPVGKVESVHRDGDRIKYRAFISSTPEARTVQQLIRDEILTATSIRSKNLTSQERDLDGIAVQEMLSGRLDGIDFAIEAGIEGAGIDRVYEEAPKFRDLEEDDDMDLSDLTLETLKEERPDLLDSHVASYVEFLNAEIERLKNELEEAKSGDEDAVSQEDHEAALTEKDERIATLEYDKAVLEAAQIGVGEVMAAKLREKASSVDEIAGVVDDVRSEALSDYMKSIGTTQEIPPEGTTREPEVEEGEGDDDEITEERELIKALAR